MSLLPSECAARRSWVPTVPAFLAIRTFSAAVSRVKAGRCRHVALSEPGDRVLVRVRLRFQRILMVLVIDPSSRDKDL